MRSIEGLENHPMLLTATFVQNHPVFFVRN